MLKEHLRLYSPLTLGCACVKRFFFFFPPFFLKSNLSEETLVNSF